MINQKLGELLVGVFAVLALCACANSIDLKPPANDTATTLSLATTNKFFIGQDLGAVRGYVNSSCCANADGTTTYIGLYKVLSKEQGFGGLGLDADGRPIAFEGDGPSGPMNAFTSATEFGAKDLAIGLSLTENEHPGALTQLLRGAHDDKIRQVAKLFKYVEGTVFLRLAYEFDGAWNVGYDNADNYIAAWRRVVDILRAEGDDNVVYVWQASAASTDDTIDKHHDNIADWYPGDDYVDWIGLSWFMNPNETAAPEVGYDAPTPGALTQEVLDFARDRRKPVMVAEASPQAFDLTALTSKHHSYLWDGPSGTGEKQLSAQEIWDYWFAPFFSLINDNDDIIDAIAYINVDWDSQEMWGPPYESGYWGDTRIEQNAIITKNWNEALADWRQ